MGAAQTKTGQQDGWLAGTDGQQGRTDRRRAGTDRQKDGWTAGTDGQKNGWTAETALSVGGCDLQVGPLQGTAEVSAHLLGPNTLRETFRFS